MSALTRPTTQAEPDAALARRKPTEAEIRAALLSWLEEPSPMAGGTMRSAIVEVINNVADVLDVAAFDVLDSSDPGRPDGDGFWRDLRPSEALYLREQLEAAVTRASVACVRIIVRELVAAGVRFAERYPDAPRQPEAVPAP